MDAIGSNSPSWKQGAILITHFIEQIRNLQLLPAVSETEALTKLSKSLCNFVSIKAWSYTTKDSTDNELYLGFYVDGSYPGTVLLNGLIDSDKIVLQMKHAGAYNITQITENSYRLTFATVEGKKIIVKKLEPLRVVPEGLQLGEVPTAATFSSFTDLFEKMEPEVKLDKFLYFAVPKRFIVDDKQSIILNPTFNKTHCIVIGTGEQGAFKNHYNDTELFIKTLSPLMKREENKPLIYRRYSEDIEVLAGMKDVIENCNDEDDVIFYISLPGGEVQISDTETIKVIHFLENLDNKTYIPLEIIELWCNYLFLIKRISRITIISEVSFNSNLPIEIAKIKVLPGGYTANYIEKLKDYQFNLKLWISKHSGKHPWLNISYHLDQKLQKSEYSKSQIFHTRTAWETKCISLFASSDGRPSYNKMFDNGNEYSIFTYNLCPEILDAFRRRINYQELFYRIKSSGSQDLKYQKPVMICHPNCEYEYITHYKPKNNDIIYQNQIFTESAKILHPNSFAINFITDKMCEISGGYLAGIRKDDEFIIFSPNTDTEFEHSWVIKHEPGLLRSIADNVNDCIIPENKISLARALLLPPKNFRIRLSCADLNDKELLDTTASISNFPMINELLCLSDDITITTVSDIKIYRLRMKTTTEDLIIAKSFLDQPKDLNDFENLLSKGNITSLISIISKYVEKATTNIDTISDKLIKSLSYFGKALSNLEQENLFFFTSPSPHNMCVRTVACVTVPCILLPYMIYLHYWQSLKIHRLKEVNNHIWDMAPKLPEDELAYSQLPCFIAPSISILDNGMPINMGNENGIHNIHIRKMGKRPLPVLNLSGLTQDTITNNAKIEFYIGMYSSVPSSFKFSVARYRFHVLKMDRMFKITTLTQSSNLTGHGFNAPFLLNTNNANASSISTLSRLGLDVIDRDFFIHFFKDSIFLNENKFDIYGDNAVTPFVYYAIIYVDDQPTVKNQFDVRFLQQSIVDQSCWMKRGDGSKANISDFDLIDPRMSARPVPIHVEIICIQMD